MHTTTPRPPHGLTRDAGWELEVRRTLDCSPEDAWQQLLTEWLPQWLGVDSVPQMVGAPLRSRGRIRGRVVGCHVGRRVRVRWTPEILDHETMFQVTLLESSNGTTLSIHQERLLGPAERQSLLEHWSSVLEQLARSLEHTPGISEVDLRG